jgi:hypothetical protein
MSDYEPWQIEDSAVSFIEAIRAIAELREADRNAPLGGYFEGPRACDCRQCRERLLAGAGP